MDENEIKEIVRFWYILGFIQAKITESSDLFEKNWSQFASIFAEKSEPESDNEEPEGEGEE